MNLAGGSHEGADGLAVYRSAGVDIEGMERTEAQGGSYEFPTPNFRCSYLEGQACGLGIMYRIRRVV